MFAPMRWVMFGATALFFSAAPSMAQGQNPGQPKPAPEANTGPAVGTLAPKFTLKDQDGKARSLDELLKKGKVALVFTRSADW